MATLIAKDSYKVYDKKQKRPVVITKGESCDEKDLKVKLARWAFITPEEAVEAAPPVFTAEGRVEAATDAPGEKRVVKRGAAKKAPAKKKAAAKK